MQENLGFRRDVTVVESQIAAHNMSLGWLSESRVNSLQLQINRKYSKTEEMDRL